MFPVKRDESNIAIDLALPARAHLKNPKKENGVN
jgi:hypothetical protein